MNELMWASSALLESDSWERILNYPTRRVRTRIFRCYSHFVCTILTLCMVTCDHFQQLFMWVMVACRVEASPYYLCRQLFSLASWSLVFCSLSWGTECLLKGREDPKKQHVPWYLAQVLHEWVPDTRVTILFITEARACFREGVSVHPVLKQDDLCANGC